jgi:hypothetical protein
MYNDEAREQFFSNNDVFLNNFCSDMTRDILRLKGVLNDANFIENARKIICELTKLIPNGDFKSPGWNGDRPLIIAGKQTPGGLIKACVGLCIIDRKIYLFAKSGVLNDERFSFPDRENTNLWSDTWRNDGKPYYKKEINLTNPNIPNPLKELEETLKTFNASL